MKVKPSTRAAVAVTLFTIFSITEAEARIGETFEQCSIRYGSPVKTIPAPAKTDQEELLLYQKSGFNVVVLFFNGKAESVVYTRISKNALDRGEQISDNEIELLLKSNSTESPWEELSLMATHRGWATRDLKMVAQYHPLENIFMVLTEAQLAREEARKSQMESKNLEGF
jgi:hypothetical protein